MRRAANSNALAILVVEELEHRVSTDQEFTAYDITRAIAAATRASASRIPPCVYWCITI